MEVTVKVAISQNMRGFIYKYYGSRYFKEYFTLWLSNAVVFIPSDCNVL